MKLVRFRVFSLQFAGAAAVSVVASVAGVWWVSRVAGWPMTGSTASLVAVLSAVCCAAAIAVDRRR